MIRLHLITGFLGSGKTTLLRHILDGRILAGGAGAARREKVALVVNELGEVGIDGAVLAREGYAMTEITEGCICCEVRGDLVQALVRIAADVSPDRIFVEATGAAETAKVLGFLFGSAELQARMTVEPVLATVDTETFERLLGPIGFLTVGQIKAADVVLLNKMDRVGPETADRVEALVRGFNRRALVVRTEFARVDLGGLLREAEGLTPAAPGPGPGKEHPPAHLGLGTLLYREPHALFDPERLSAALADLPETLFRLKGFVRTAAGPRLLSFVAGTHRWHPAPDRGVGAPTELVAVGQDLDPDRVQATLDRGHTDREPTG